MSNRELILDGSKLAWHRDRVEAWLRGERIAPICIDMALTRACNYACKYCYAVHQDNKSFRITKEHMTAFLDDCKEIGVKAVSEVSDGESSISPAYAHSIKYGHSIGLDMASGTNAYIHNEKMLREILPCLTYFRVNISAGEPKRYSEIMGVKEESFYKVVENIKTAVRLKKENGWGVTIGLKMVCFPEYRHDVLPLAKLGKELRADYLQIKHVSDTETGAIGVKYQNYDEEIFDIFRQAEKYSDDEYKVIVKWNKLLRKGTRPYSKCRGWPFMLQISGSGLVTSCGMHFNDKFKKYHLGNITQKRFKDIWASDEYMRLLEHLRSDNFDAKKECGSLCLQDATNVYLDDLIEGRTVLSDPIGEPPAHVNFI